MANWSQHHDLVYAFVCVSFLADGEVDESEKEAMRGNVKVMLPDLSDDAYNQIEAEVIDKFIDLLRRRWQSSQIQIKSSYKSLFIGRNRRLHAIFL